jgi:regulator of nucleoside diphosphate kinase
MDQHQEALKTLFARPAVHATASDRRRLRALLEGKAVHERVVAHFLTAELDRAMIYSARRIPSDVATLNSRLVYRTTAAAGEESRILVHPDEYVPSGQHILVTTPLGAALFGLRAGATLSYPTPSGRTFRVRLERVAYQPEAAARA